MSGLPTAVVMEADGRLALPLLVLGMATWTFGEYVLHRFAMHERGGRGILSREHLEHHVKAAWGFDPLIVLAWVGVVLVGVLGVAPVGLVFGGPVAGASLGAGWIVGYFLYEYLDAAAHLRGPRGRYTRWLRMHHFHHHFGHPMRNHGVTTAFWDRAFGTLDRPDVVAVPRRMAMPWLVSDGGELRAEHAADYALVGAVDSDERLAALDRARAFASLAPTSA